MRLATVHAGRGLRLHVRSTTGDGYVDVADATGREHYTELGAVLAEGEVALDAIRRVASREGTRYSDGDLGPAVPRPPRILCLGVNYLEHALEGGRKAPSWPESFVRGADTVAAPYGPLVRPALSERFDYEGELGLVIGAGGRLIPAEKALEAIAGYVVLNDASAREWQRAASQWTPGKNFDATMPIGPWVVTTDEVDVSDVQLTTTLNGQVMQSARTSQMIVGVPSIVEYLSSFTTLRPGDVIATGTPGGVGFARTPPVWMKAGDVVEVSIEGVGWIRNEVVDEAVDVSGWRWRPEPKTSSL
ncbi:MAG: fumarylacetoacetate hydrolase family protein [Acidimicrobiales bacterium]